MEIKKVAELSSDDYHMDRAIFYACQDARTRFCSTVQAGDGRIYKCLMEHKMEETMTEDVSCCIYFIHIVSSSFASSRSLGIFEFV